MPISYQAILQNNQAWVKNRLAEDPEFFKKMGSGQNPPFLYIGCSDSRMSLNTMTSTQPGEIFIHRNIANQVSLTDINFLSVLEYAVDVLCVRHIIVAGHTNCGGIEAAIKNNASGLVENWLMPVKDIYTHNRELIDAFPTFEERSEQLSILNAIAQLKNVCKTSIMHRAFQRETYPLLHAWMIDVHTGLIRALPFPVAEWKELGLLPADYPLELAL